VCAQGVLCLVRAFNKPAHACGIVAYVGQDRAVDYLLEGLKILQNRGYDRYAQDSLRMGAQWRSESEGVEPVLVCSAGIATVDAKGAMIVTKHASTDKSTSDSIDLLVADAPQHTGEVGLAHTRW
jgi:glucosamine--fructose-6-phosphate aminotransferase (isomerizing)